MRALLIGLALALAPTATAQQRPQPPQADELRRAIQAQPYDASPRAALVQTLLRADALEEAEAEARAARDVLPRSAALAALHGEALLALDRLEAARNAYRQAQALLGAPQALPVEAAPLRMREAETTVRMAQRAFEAERYDQAARWFGDAWDLLPDRAGLAFNRALALRRAGRPEAARETADRALERFGDHADLLRLRGALLLDSGDVEGVSAAYAQLYQSDPRVETGLSYGRALLAQGRYADAQRLFDELLTRFPGRTDLYDELDALNTGQGYTARALAVRRRQQQRAPGDASVLRRIGDLLRQLDRPADARAAYDSLAALGSDAPLAQLTAGTFADEERYAEAAQAYRAHVQARPDDAARWATLAALHQEAGQSAAAAQAYERALRTESLAAWWTRLGAAREALGQTDVAADAYRQALELEPRQAEASVALTVLSRSDDVSAARRVLLRAATGLAEAGSRFGASMQHALARTDRPESAVWTDDALQRVALERAQRTFERAFGHVASFEPDRAEPVVEELVARYPSSPAVLLLAGGYDETRGRLEQARGRYAAAARSSPNSVEAHLASARLAERLGQRRDALASYERAAALASLDPDANAEAYRALVRLHRAAGTLDALIRRLQARYRAHPFDGVLRETLLDALHRAGRSDEARALARTQDDPDDADGTP